MVHIFREKLDDILEYRCDQAVLKGSSETERIIYTETLLTVARQAAAFPGQRKRLGAVGFLSSHPENTLITRTNLILRGKENYVVAKLISLVCIALFIGSYLLYGNLLILLLTLCQALKCPSMLRIPIWSI